MESLHKDRAIDGRTLSSNLLQSANFIVQSVPKWGVNNLGISVESVKNFYKAPSLKILPKLLN